MMKITASKFLLLLLASTTLATVVEQQRYPNLKIRTKITGLDLSYAYKLKYADTSKLSFDTNWGKIVEDKTSKTEALPAEYANSEILRIDTSQAFLELIGFTADNKCLATVWWDKITKWTLSFSMTKTECQRLRITSFPLEIQKKLLSYITDTGSFRWYFLKDSKTQFSNWQEVADFNLYEKGVIASKDEPHGVAFYHRNTYDIDRLKDIFTFTVYQKSATKAGDYPKDEIWVVETDKDFDEQGVVMKFKQLSSNYRTLVKADGPIQSVSWIHGPDNNKHATIITSFKLEDGKIRYSFNDVDTSQNPPVSLKTRFARIESGFAGFTVEGREVVYYFEIDTKAGQISLCDTQFPEFEHLFKKESISWRYECITKFKIDELKLTEESFIDDVEIRSDQVIVIKTKKKGSQDLDKEVILNMGAYNLPKKFHTRKNNYAANSAKLYEVQNKLGVKPMITSYNLEVLTTSYLLSFQPLKDGITVKAYDTEAREKAVEHKLQYTKVDNFVPDSIDDTPIQIDSQKYRFFNKAASLENKIKATGDFIATEVHDPLSKVWFSLAPIERPTPKSPEQVSKEHKDVKNYPVRLGQQPIVIRIDSPSDVLEICHLKNYYVFSKDNKLHSFSKKIPGLKNKYYYLVDLSQYNIEVGSVFCSKKSDLVMVRDHNGQHYSVLSFDFGAGNGEFALRKFFYEMNLFEFSELKLDKEGKKYDLKMNNGESVYVHFENMFPYLKIDENVGDGEVDVLGKKVKFIIQKGLGENRLFK